MSRNRIQARPSKVGAGLGNDPDAIADLEARIERHERLTRDKPKKSFGQVLERQMRGDVEPEPPPPPAPPGAIEPHLGLDPRQDPRLASGKGRGAKVILKG